MRKTLIIAAAFAMAVVGMTSCENRDEEKCWKMEVTLNGETETAYGWVSANKLDSITEAFKQYDENIKIVTSEVKEYETKYDCEGQNVQ